MEPKPSHCLNCESPMEPDHRFCPVCGQQTDTGKLTLAGLASDFLVNLFSVDRGIFSLISAMIRQPGHTARAYTLGKRKSMFPPFTYLTLMVGLVSLLMVQTHFISGSGFGQNNPVSRFAEENVNLVILLNVPFLALVARWIWGFQGPDLADFLILSAYTAGTRSLAFMCIILPLHHFFPDQYSLLLSGYVFCWVLYVAWAMRQFTGNFTWQGWLRSLLAPVASQFLLILLIGSFFFLQALLFPA